MEKTGLTLADCIAEANIWVADAQALGNTSAGVAATKLRAQLAGHLVERKEVSTKGQLDDMDIAALAKMRDEANRLIQVQVDAAAEAAALTGAVVAPTPQLRRVIG